MEKIKGWIVLTNTISGYELAWHCEEEDKEVMPEIFDTERDAQLAIIEDVENDIAQFQDMEREYDDIQWPEDEYVVAEIEIDEDGKLTVYQQSESINVPGMIIKNTIIETDIEIWRTQL